MMVRRMTILSALGLAVILLFSGCVTEIESFLNGASSSPPAAASSDPLDGYVFAYVDGLAGGYHVARIVQPASTATNNEAEILDMGEQGNKRWARVFTTRPALEGDLSVGEVVLHQGSGFSDPDTETLVATTWTAYYVTDVSSLYRDEVMVGTMTVSTKHLRVPDTEIEIN